MVKKPKLYFKASNIKKFLLGIGVFYGIVLLISVVGGLFYLFEYRPSMGIDAPTEQAPDSTVISGPQTLISELDKLLPRGDTKYELSLGKRDTIKISLVAENKITRLTLKNMDSGNDICVIRQPLAALDTILVIRFPAVYQLIITSAEKQYFDLAITNLSASNSSENGMVVRDTVLCEKADEGAIAFRGLDFTKIYKEPQKNTLASQGKTILGGRAKVVIPVNLPKGTTVWAYQLRISTSKQDKNSDETFVRSMSEGYKKVKIFGIPAYEVNKKSTNIVRELLNSISGPDREEDAFCDFYLFTDKREANKFSRGAADYKYYNEYSYQGTQSNQGEIPTNGRTSFFIGLENTRFSTTVYTWIDAVATVPTTRYYQINFRSVPK